MTINNWNGTVSKEMFDLSSVESNYQTFIQQTKKYLTNCLIGNAHLTGSGSLLEYFEDIIEEVVERGEIAVIEVGKEKLLAIPNIQTQNLTKQEIAIEFTLLDNSEEKFTNKEIEKWVIFKLNKEGTAHLAGLDFWTKRLANLLNKMERDLVISERGIRFTLPEWPDGGDVKLLTKSFEQRPFFFMCFPKSQKANPKEGKQGIAPHQIKAELHEPTTDQRAYMIRDFKFIWTNMERAFGIRHDTLQEKEERASVSEVFSSQANFDACEKKIYRLLIKSIQEYNRIFEEGKGNYSFKFGRIGN
jgi:hypothetical protein